VIVGIVSVWSAREHLFAFRHVAAVIRHDGPAMSAGRGRRRNAGLEVAAESTDSSMTIR
jgi:hypothetical protein